MYYSLYDVCIFGIKLSVGEFFCDYLETLSFNFDGVCNIVYDESSPHFFVGYTSVNKIRSERGIPPEM